MKRSRYLKANIVSILKEAEKLIPVSELCRAHAIVALQLSIWRTAAKRKSLQDCSLAFANLSVMADF